LKYLTKTTTRAITDHDAFISYQCFVTGSKDKWIYMYKNFEKGA